jgi:tetratricopeptide (TPR) repeat protein
LRLAEADAALDNLPLAATEAQRAATMFEKTFGASHVFLAEPQTILAEIEGAQAHWSTAQSLAKKAFDLNRSNLPAGHPATARAQSALGLALWKQGHAAEAAPLLEAAYHADRKIFHDVSGTRQSARVVANWAAFLRATGRKQEAEQVESECRMLTSK